MRAFNVNKLVLDAMIVLCRQLHSFNTENVLFGLPEIEAALPILHCGEVDTHMSLWKVAFAGTRRAGCATEACGAKFRFGFSDRKEPQGRCRALSQRYVAYLQWIEYVCFKLM